MEAAAVKRMHTGDASKIKNKNDKGTTRRTEKKRKKNHHALLLCEEMVHLEE